MKKIKLSVFTLLCLFSLVLLLNSPTYASNGNTIVHYTKTGECYHKENCRYLSKSDFTGTLSYAVESLGLRPCSVCKPPRYNATPASNNSNNSFQSEENTSNNSATLTTVLSCLACFAGGFGLKKVVDNKKELRNREKEKKFNYAQERTALLNRLNGQSIQAVAGVPKNIRFVGGYPIDNNDKPFGSYTVYISSNGKHYHQRAGCCSAKTPIHAFRAYQNYRSCGKCCKKHIDIPQ